MRKILFLIIALIICTFSLKANPINDTVTTKINGKDIIAIIKREFQNGTTVLDKNFKIDRSITHSGGDRSYVIEDLPQILNTDLPTILKKVLGAKLLNDLIIEDQAMIGYAFFIRPNGTVENLEISMSGTPLVSQIPPRIYFRLYKELSELKFFIGNRKTNAPYFFHTSSVRVRFFKDK